MTHWKCISFCAGLALTTLTGCVQHTWAPGPEAAQTFGVASGQCKLASMGADQGGGFVGAIGSPKFVGIAVGSAIVAGAIAGAVRQQNIYNACMESQGFVATDTNMAQGSGR